MRNLINKQTSKAKAIMQSESGLSGTVETVLIIILVIGLITAIFAPMITDWFEDVMTKLSAETADLFDFTENSADYVAN